MEPMTKIDRLILAANHFEMIHGKRRVELILSADEYDVTLSKIPVRLAPSKSRRVHRRLIIAHSPAKLLHRVGLNLHIVNSIRGTGESIKPHAFRPSLGSTVRSTSTLRTRSTGSPSTTSKRRRQISCSLVITWLNIGHSWNSKSLGSSIVGLLSHWENLC